MTTHRFQRPKPQALLAALPLTALLNISVFAQTDNAPQGPSLAESISRLSIQARTFIELVARESEGMQDWSTGIAWLMIPVIILYSGMREYHDNSGHGKHLFWWFGRLAVCLFLLGSGQGIISEFYVVGHELATGNLNAGYESPLYNLYQQRELDFHLNYQKMVNNQFQVKVGDNVEYGTFDPDGYKFLFPLYTNAGNEPRDIMTKMNQPKWIMQAGFAVMNASRAVLEMGNMWIVILSGLIILIYKVTCPIFIALAVDRRFSHRMVHAWVWGLIISTLVWPCVAYFLRAMAYLGGNLGLSVSGNDPIYQWNEETLTVIQNSDAHPVYLIAFGSVMMLGSGLALWFSPLIAYRLAYGQVFEVVTQTASQLGAAIGGLGVSMYNGILGAAITRQAENIQIQAGYDASTSMARADRRAQDLGVQAGQIGSLAGIRASQVKGLIDTRAGLAAALKGIEADKLFGQKNAAIGMDLTKLLTSVGAEKDAEATGISASQNLRQLYASTRGQYWSLAGGKIGAVLPDSSIIGRIGSAAGVGVQGYGISDVYDRQRQVATDALHGFNGEGIFNPTGTNKNSFTAMEGQFRAFDDNLKGVQANQQVFADTRSQISREQTNAVIGGINQSANIQRDGVFQSNERQFQANQIRMDAQIQAQTITRAAAAEVTRINFENRLRQAIYDAAAKLIEKHLEQRF